MLKKNILALLCFCLLLFSLGLGASDLIGPGSICQTASCAKVHSSSFARIFDIPVAFFGATGLLAAMFLFYFKKKEAGAIIMYALCGFEAYFTFIEAVYIKSWCILCVIFFCFLLIVTVLIGVKNIKAPVVILFTFFLAHFIFFYPNITLKSNLIYAHNFQEKLQIEIFASPSCDHCHDAISELKEICMIVDTGLIIRPVSLSATDAKASVQWVCKSIFKNSTATSKRLAEKIIWENEREVKKLCGNITAPLICINFKNKTQPVTFTGWNKDIKMLVYNSLTNLTDNSMETKGSFCGKKKECS